MNILLTGGAGYIGSHTAVVLSRAGHKVVLYDNLSNSSDLVIARIEEVAGQGVVFIKGDVRDTASMRNALASHEINAVIHFAGLKAVGESAVSPIDYYSNNVQGAISLMRSMQSENVRTLVFSSSATVYGEPQYLPLDENHPTAATNPYGRTKLQIEEMLRDVAISDPLWRVVCLRYFNPVGAHESGLLGENPIGVPSNLMPHMAQVAAGQLAELKVFGGDYPTPDGTGVRDYIHVMDLAEGHAAALRFLSETNGCHAINLGTGKGNSVLEVVAAFERACCRKVPYALVARRAGDVAECYANVELASKLLNWTANRSLDEMCVSTWAFHLSMGSEIAP